MDDGERKLQRVLASAEARNNERKKRGKSLGGFPSSPRSLLQGQHGRRSSHVADRWRPLWRAWAWQVRAHGARQSKKAAGEIGFGAPAKRVKRGCGVGRGGRVGP